MKIWLWGSGFSFRTGIDSRWIASASSSRPRNRTTAASAVSRIPRSGSSPTSLGELEGLALERLGLLELPEPEQPVAEASRHPAHVPLGAGSLRELEPLPQHRLGPSDSPRRDRRGSRAGCCSSASGSRTRRPPWPGGTPPRSSSMRLGRAPRLGEADRERLRRLRVDERRVDTRRPSRRRGGAAARPPRSGPAARGTSRADGARRRAPRARRAARASRPPSGAACSLSSSRASMSSGMTSRAAPSRRPPGRRSPRTPRARGGRPRRSRRSGRSPTRRRRARGTSSTRSSGGSRARPPVARPRGTSGSPRRAATAPTCARPAARVQRKALRRSVVTPLARLAELVEVAERLELVGRDQLGDLLGAVAGALLGPPRDAGVLVGAQRLRQRVVGAVADQVVPERELVLVGEATRARAAARAPSRAAARARRGPRSTLRPVSSATAPTQNTRPTTAASWSTAFSSSGRPSRRAAIRPWIERGSSTSLDGSRHLPLREASVARSTPSSISLRTISST